MNEQERSSAMNKGDQQHFKTEDSAGRTSAGLAGPTYLYILRFGI